MIKICRDLLEVKKYKEYSFRKNGTAEIPVLTIDKTCFWEAGKIFAEGHVLVEVRSKEGKTIFYFKKCRDMIEGFTGMFGEVNLNFPKSEHLTEEKILIQGFWKEQDIFCLRN